MSNSATSPIRTTSAQSAQGPRVDSAHSNDATPTAADRITASWVSSAEHALHLAELRPASPAAHGAAILFIHGLFTDGRFFLGKTGGAARWFTDRGFAVFVGDLRGHGVSRWPAERRWAWDFDAYAREDIPALVRAVRERHDGPIFVVAHSLGGYATLVGMAMDADIRRELRGVVVLSAAVNDFSDGGWRKVAAVGASSALSTLVGRFPAKALKQGSADEPAALMRQFHRWARTSSFKSSDESVDYWSALSSVTTPLLALVGEADRFHASPARAKKLVDHVGSVDKKLIICGRTAGFERDFGHVDVARGAAAEREVLPRVRAWIEALC